MDDNALTLTGASMTSGSVGAGSSKPVLVASGLSSSFNSHPSAGAIGSKKPCCNHHAAPTPVEFPAHTLPKVEDFLSLPSAQERHNVLSLLVRSGTYEVFLPYAKALADSKMHEQEWNLKSEKDGHTLLHWAAKRVDDVRFASFICPLVSSVNVCSNDSVGMAPLHWLCTATTLVGRGGVPPIFKILCVILEHGGSLEIKDKSGCTPLLIAAQYGNADLCAVLLQRGASIRALDNQKDSALHWAAYKGSVGVCGLLLYQAQDSVASQLSTPDSFGQTPLHLSSLRGHADCVRYLLQECGSSGGTHPSASHTRRSVLQLLQMRDSRTKTALDLAVDKKRDACAEVLRDAEAEWSGSSYKTIFRTLRQCLSWHSWKVWLGAEESPNANPTQCPLYLVLLNWTVLNGLFFHVYVSKERGILWDYTALHLFSLLSSIFSGYLLYMTYMTDPGLVRGVDNKNNSSGARWGILNTRRDKSLNEITQSLRREYEETLEALAHSEVSSGLRKPLCHSCHIVRPPRSKHCRVAKRCVLLFDHHCPFVGSTVGLYNYKYFYLLLLAMTVGIASMSVTWIVYLSRASALRKASSEHHDLWWGVFVLGLYSLFFILPAGGMFIYHTQLISLNLTTNEHQNFRRYSYMQDPETGRFRNPFHRGSFLGNLSTRLFPGRATYELPEEHRDLVSNVV